jgi:hypothetical protein
VVEVRTADCASACPPGRTGRTHRTTAALASRTYHEATTIALSSNRRLFRRARIRWYSKFVPRARPAQPRGRWTRKWLRDLREHLGRTTGRSAAQLDVDIRNRRGGLVADLVLVVSAGPLQKPKGRTHPPRCSPARLIFASGLSRAQLDRDQTEIARTRDRALGCRERAKSFCVQTFDDERVICDGAWHDLVAAR